MIPNANTPRILFPKDLDEACRIQANPKTRGRLIAGGTDLMAQWAAGVPVPERVVSLKNLPGLTGITVTPEDDPGLIFFTLPDFPFGKNAKGTPSPSAVFKRDETNVKTPIAGVVRDILHKEGAQLQQGDLVVILE